MPAEQSEKFKAQLAVANIWLSFNGKKSPVSDPWTMNDSFRVNGSAFEKVNVLNQQTQETETVYVEYLPDNRFSVHKGELVDNTRECILENVQVTICPEDDKQLIISMKDSQIKIPFLIERDGRPMFFDDDGQPTVYQILEDISVG